MIAVAVFDDNKMRRTGLEAMINSSDGMQCVGTFEDCREVVLKVSRCKPDVVLMDIDMPNVNGIEGLILLRKHFPDLKILMQTVFEEDEKIFAAICAGADGYILKKASPAKLIDGIKEVMEGGAPMSPSVARQTLLLFSHRNAPKKDEKFNLSERELEILNLRMKGYSYKMIADECNIAYPTVSAHIRNIYEKLKVHSIGEAISKVNAEMKP